MHWSYAEIEKADGDLCQGDILLPTEALITILDSAHRWFLDPKYLGFILITQTCDMVRRDRELCKTPYLEIAVIRPLRGYLLPLLKQTCNWIGHKFFPSSDRDKAYELLDRIMNQNEATLGLFYLHPEAEIGIAEESVALLRVSIALRSEHYNALVNARKGRLDPEFANKLGWLCGNLYSRVGIRDWNEYPDDKIVAKQIRKQLLQDSGDDCPEFVDYSKELSKAIENKKVDLRNKTEAEIQELMAQYPLQNYKAKAIDAVTKILTEQGISEGTIKKVRNNLSNNTEFTSAVKQGSS